MKKEIGVPGNSPVWGSMSTDEYISKLVGSVGLATYDQMRRSDPQIKACRRAITLPILAAEYSVEPASDDPLDVEIAEFVKKNLLDEMTTTWRATLKHIMLMSDFGFSPLEKVYELHKEDGKIHLRKMDPRLPRSITRWNFNNEKHELESLEQTDTDGKRLTIPIQKLIIFTNEKEGDNWEGVSDLRCVYGPWFIKNDLIKIDAIKHDRYGVGIPTATAPEGVQQGSDAWTNAETMLKAIHANEQAWALFPAGWQANILGGGQNAGTDVLGSIRFHNEQIAVSYLAQFISLGTTQTGSRALGESFVGFFLMGLQERAEYICETINRFVIRELVNYNWDVDDYPKLTVAKIKELPLETLAALKNAGFITPDAPTENAVRRQVGLPEIDEETYEERHQAPEVTRPAVPEEETEPDEEEEPDSDDVEDEETDSQDPREQKNAESCGHAHGIHLADRELTEEEKIPDFTGMALRLDTSVETVQAQILQFRDRQLKAILDQLLAGKAIQNIAVPLKKEMYEILIAAYRDMYRQGRADAREEILKQASRFSMSDPVSDEELFALVREELSMKVEAAADKLKAMAAAIVIDVKKTGAAGDELRSIVTQRVGERIADKTWGDLAAAAINQGWGAGRNAETLAWADGIEYMYRSGILDGNICEVCGPKDGVRHAIGDPLYMTPDPNCKGGPERCRCINVAVMKSESAPEDGNA